LNASSKETKKFKKVAKASLCFIIRKIDLSNRNKNIKQKFIDHPEIILPFGKYQTD
jgi:hypothetical protein